jgi:DNA polymerase
MIRKANEAASAAEFLPARLTLTSLQKAARECRGCDLHLKGTQTVFGEGPRTARIVFVGEQPGDAEDLAGRPFVGPAGKLLDRALQDAAIPRELAYVTNAVKHFNWVPRGKKRLHAKPQMRHLDACRPWLQAELEVIKPAVLVCLGATAAQSLLGRAFRITQQRGKVLTDTIWAPAVVATVHPSSILRSPDDESRHRNYDAFVQDLRVIKPLV